MRVENIVISTLFILLSLVVLFIIYAFVLQNNNNIACKNLGFESKGRTVSGITTCKDYEGNPHFIEFMGFWEDKAREISIGNNRIIGVD